MIIIDRVNDDNEWSLLWLMANGLRMVNCDWMWSAENTWGWETISRTTGWWRSKSWTVMESGRVKRYNQQRQLDTATTFKIRCGTILVQHRQFLMMVLIVCELWCWVNIVGGYSSWCVGNDKLRSWIWQVWWPGWDTNAVSQPPGAVVHWLKVGVGVLQSDSIGVLQTINQPSETTMNHH